MSEAGGATAVRLVVVEDDDSLRELLAAGLRFAGYDVRTASSGDDALRLVAQDLPDLVVLDVNLPDTDGFEICRRLRASGDEVPVIFLTARTDPDDLRAGFDGGADDYVPKPFRLDELTFRIGAVLRRTGRRSAAAPAGRLSCGHVSLDEVAHRAWSEATELSLTPTEFRLLRYLLANPERALTRAQILEHVWGYDFDGDWQVIETYVSSLRRKLDDGRLPRIVHTVRGIGYAARRPAP